MESPHERALRDIEEAFGDRLKRGGPAPPGVPDAGDTLASVSPMSVEEVKLLAEVAGRYSVPLIALGAGMASKPEPEGGGILIHFDLMRGLRLHLSAKSPGWRPSRGRRGCNWTTSCAPGDGVSRSILRARP
jgi:hypothetical protein